MWVKSVVKSVLMVFKCCMRIDISRCVVFVNNVSNCYIFGKKLLIFIFKMVYIVFVVFVKINWELIVYY